jgi:hypothetical protein
LVLLPFRTRRNPVSRGEDPLKKQKKLVTVFKRAVKNGYQDRREFA